MKIDRKKLLQELKTVSGGLSKNEVIEQSDCFAFKGGEVMTFNDEIACRVKTCLDIVGVVHGAELLGILNKMKEEEIEITLDDLHDLIGIISAVEEDLQNLDLWLKIENDMQPLLENIEHFRLITNEIHSLQKLCQSIESIEVEIDQISEYVKCEPTVEILRSQILEHRTVL